MEKQETGEHVPVCEGSILLFLGSDLPTGVTAACSRGLPAMGQLEIMFGIPQCPYSRTLSIIMCSLLRLCSNMFAS